MRKSQFQQFLPILENLLKKYVPVLGKSLSSSYFKCLLVLCCLGKNEKNICGYDFGQLVRCRYTIHFSSNGISYIKSQKFWANKFLTRYFRTANSQSFSPNFGRFYRKFGRLKTTFSVYWYFFHTRIILHL